MNAECVRCGGTDGARSKEVLPRSKRWCVSPATKGHASEGLPALFAYRAVRKDGTIELGELPAENVEVARARLVSQGLFLLDLRDSKERPRSRTLKSQEVAQGLRLLASLLASGLP